MEDTQFKGVGLLNNEDLRTDFNADRSNFLITDGIDASSRGLGLGTRSFLTLTFLNAIIKEVRAAKEIMRDYAATIKTDLSIITTRQDFTRFTINTHESGSDDLVVADQNEKGAELLALDVRQQLQFEALALSSVSAVANILL